MPNTTVKLLLVDDNPRVLGMLRGALTPLANVPTSNDSAVRWSVARQPVADERHRFGPVAGDGPQELRADPYQSERQMRDVFCRRPGDARGLWLAHGRCGSVQSFKLYRGKFSDQLRKQNFATDHHIEYSGPAHGRPAHAR